MSDKTAIEWARADDGTPGATWNPVRGCSKVSEGCRNCYAMGVAYRFSGDGQPYAGLARKVGGKPEWTGKVMLVEDALEQPFHWRKARRVFVNSMSDLFHPDVPDEFIARVWAVMSLAAWHTYQILTKRPERMQALLSDRAFRRQVVDAAGAMIEGDFAWRAHPAPWRWPLSNIWLGVSVEDQAAADQRVPLLLQTPAAVRFVSAEPLLGPVDLTSLLCGDIFDGEGAPYYDALAGFSYWPSGDFGIHGPALNWVIVGGESGPHARPMDPLWAKSLRDQCQAAGVPYFFKQWGEYRPGVVVDAPWHQDGQFVEMLGYGGCAIHGANLHYWEGGIVSAQIGRASCRERV